MNPEDQDLINDIPKGIPLSTDESKNISDVLDRTNKNLSMKGKVEEKKPELTEYQAPNLDALNQGLNGDMSALKTGLFKSSLITEAIKNQSEQRQAELENRAYDKFSSDQRNLIGQANAQLQPFNEFKPPKESMGQVAGFQAAMMLFAGLIGGKGALGGMAALNAAGGMMKGYADGQKEVFEKAKQEFEENMRVVQANNARVMEILRNNMELAKTDLQVATNKAKNDFIINGQPTIADAISKAGLPAFTQFYGNALKDMNDGLKVIDSLGGGGKEKQVADYIVNNNVAPKTAEQMAAVQKYYPNYKAPEVTTGKSAINERFANNVFRGANEVANSFDQINQQGITTGRGILGGVTGKGTISSVLASDLASSLTDEDQVNYNTNVADLGLEMATVLSGGYRVNQSVIDKIQNALQVNPGDTYGNAAYKFATGIRKLKVALEAQPTYNDTQLKAKNNLLARLDKYATPEQILEKTGKPRVSRQDLQKIAKDKNVSYAEAERLAKRKGYIVIEQFPSLTVEDISKEKTGE